jgi:hypothetical protein
MAVVTLCQVQVTVIRPQKCRREHHSLRINQAHEELSHDTSIHDFTPFISPDLHRYDS